MILYILLDLNIPAWGMTDEVNPLNNIQVFVQALVLSKYGNICKIVNNRTIVYDSTKDNNFNGVFRYVYENIKAGAAEDLRITPKDLGYALMDKPDQILYFGMSNEDSTEYLEYLKCMFVSQSRNIKINGYSYRNNMLIKMCIQGSGGRYLENCSLQSLLGLLGLPKPEKDSYEINCTCCSKPINLAMVCPICLAVYCKFIPVCKRCKTKFSFVK